MAALFGKQTLSSRDREQRRTFRNPECATNVRKKIVRIANIQIIIKNAECGVIAQGHPIGVTGGVLTRRLLHSMKRDGAERGVLALDALHRE
jgi:acetyl-CoA C-acetyltransferase